MSFLSLNQLGYHYPDGWLGVSRVDWAIARGQFCCLVGRSGCGKTTLLKLAAGLIKPDQGTITLNGKPLLQPSHQIGFVFQSPNLLEWKNVLDNVLLPVSLQRRAHQQDITLAKQLLQQVGLGEHMLRYPGELSGGQQSRAAMARALILSPALLLLDEPFAAQDAMTREELQDDLLRMCKIGQTTVLFVTHDIHEAVYLADQVAVMELGAITQKVPVNLSRPRGKALRYSPSFNTLCAQVRDALDGVAA
jgi:NitT/TauT family transport system ATP-binding protein